jgi:hypothetical protein
MISKREEAEYRKRCKRGKHIYKATFVIEKITETDLFHADNKKEAVEKAKEIREYGEDYTDSETVKKIKIAE